MKNLPPTLYSWYSWYFEQEPNVNTPTQSPLSGGGLFLVAREGQNWACERMAVHTQIRLDRNQFSF